MCRYCLSNHNNYCCGEKNDFWHFIYVYLKTLQRCCQDDAIPINSTSTENCWRIGLLVDSNQRVFFSTGHFEIISRVWKKSAKWRRKKSNMPQYTPFKITKSMDECLNFMITRYDQVVKSIRISNCSLWTVINLPT